MANKIFWTVFFLLIFTILLSQILMVKKHEETHQAIYKYFDYNSTIHYWIGGGWVTLDPNQILNETDEKIISSLQSVNELVSYQYGVEFELVAFLFIILLVGFDIYFSKLLKKLERMEFKKDLEGIKKEVDIHG